jgi:hypothetical protein
MGTIHATLSFSFNPRCHFPTAETLVNIVFVAALRSKTELAGSNTDGVIGLLFSI